MALCHFSTQRCRNGQLTLNLHLFGQFLHTLREYSTGNLRSLLKNLRSQQKFYAAAGCDKYLVWIKASILFKSNQEPIAKGWHWAISRWSWPLPWPGSTKATCEKFELKIYHNHGFTTQSSSKSKETDVGEQCSGGEGEEAIAKKLVNENIEVLFKII